MQEHLHHHVQVLTDYYHHQHLPIVSIIFIALNALIIVFIDYLSVSFRANSFTSACDPC